MMMMVMENEFQERSNLNINDIDLSLLRLSSPPPYDYSRSSFLSAASPDDISPLKRSSPVSDESDQPKRRRVSLQDPIFITSPLSSIDDPTRKSPVPEKQETSPFDSKSFETERMKMVNNHVEEITHEETNYDTYEEIYREETNYDAYETQQEEECGEGMRIERSGDGFVIRLKCRCKLAYRILFSDHHLYFKSL
ncbi:hypothetical protein Bca4012_002222 [Brassica carinata]|uniref:(rape) hypothetical protein n=1 Tax=Brassica napus TaxID=3708 RepID=A0A816I7Z8_BRANA|nr:uncharacterized protein LOC106409645 [Brassica napus]KAH0889709.1 hypothetical protein HID58_052138 [Brassica napus]CAF1700594.1 unnamed protein product [Brassica napus]